MSGIDDDALFERMINVMNVAAMRLDTAFCLSSTPHDEKFAEARDDLRLAIRTLSLRRIGKQARSFEGALSVGNIWQATEGSVFLRYRIGAARWGNDADWHLTFTDLGLGGADLEISAGAFIERIKATKAKLVSADPTGGAHG